MEILGKVRGRLSRTYRRTVRGPAAADGSGTSSREGAPPEGDIRTPTHLGPALDSRARRAWRQMRVGVDDDYDLVQRHFDVFHYLLQSPGLLERPHVDLVAHYLSGDGRRPSPDPHFSAGAYLARHPQRRAGGDPYVAWLREGRAAGEIADPAAGIHDLAPALGLSPHEVAGRVAERRQDLVERLRTGTLGEMIVKAAEIEPLIGQAWVETTRPVLLPFSRSVVTGQVAAIRAAQEVAGFRRARLVIVVNRPRWGGGRRMEGHLAHALAGRIEPADVVVVYTDGSGTTPEGRFPAGVREIDLAGLTEGLDPEAAQSALVALLRSFGSDAIVNVNSRMLYLAMRSYGRALAASERVFLCFFCNERSATGAWFGWSLRYFYRTFDEVAGVLTDSEHLADELVRTHRLPPSQRDRLQVLHAPVDPRLPVVTEPPAREGRRPQVFWAGRFGRQKRIGLLLALARRMPDVDFRVWGDGQQLRGVPPNLTLQGRYGHISEIPLADADAWLYTSGWDGVPSQLLEVAVTGIPIVGTLVGGTGEVLHAGESWPVPQDAGPPAYEEALRSVLADPVDARRRALALRERMVRERAAGGFAERVSALLLTEAGAGT